MTRKPASPSIARQILWVLMDSPRPLFLNEIVTALGGEYPGPYLMPTLVWLRTQGKIGCEVRAKPGKGPKRARTYFYVPPSDLFQQKDTQGAAVE
ncbi:MAG: hypothetical protein KBE25_00555 [Laribacter sp.]|nr:hypothetical protein [Laribacter sp.]MBP9607836.1 hypothetical protein [Laribacter sp.]